MVEDFKRRSFYARGTSKTICWALAGLAICWAQNPANTSGTFEGIVTSTAGEPLKNVSVQLVAQRPTGTPPDGKIPVRDAYTVVTDAAGRFAFDSLPAGGYAIRYRRTGYQPQDSSLTIDSAQPRASVSIQLTPFGRMEGTVTDEDGEPFRGTISVDGTASSNIGADGTFVISVIPGHHYIQARPDESGEMTGSWPREKDVATYYPGSVTISGATKVKVPAGAVIRGLDIRMRRIKVYAVRGRAIDGSSGKPAASTNIQLVEDEPIHPEMTSARTLADGSFEFKNVQPGAYTATAGTAGVSGLRLSPRLFILQPVVVGHENVADLELTLQRGAEIRGRVTMESGEAPKPAAPLRLTLRARDGNRGAQIQDDGRFVISDVAPQKYIVQMFTRMPQTYVKSVRLNQQEITGLAVDLSSGTGGALEVVLSPHAPEVSGTIRNAAGVAMPQTTVTVWKRGGTSGGIQVPPEATAVTDENGVFRISSLAPGEYRAAAWAHSTSSMVLTPEFLSQFDTRAAVLRLEESQRVSVDVPLISEEAIDQAEESER